MSANLKVIKLFSERLRKARHAGFRQILYDLKIISYQNQRHHNAIQQFLNFHLTMI